MNSVVLDTSSKHEPSWAVVWKDQLLPVRFSSKLEASRHLESMRLGRVYEPPDEEEQRGAA